MMRDTSGPLMTPCRDMLTLVWSRVATGLAKGWEITVKDKPQQKAEKRVDGNARVSGVALTTPGWEENTIPLPTRFVSAIREAPCSWGPMTSPGYPGALATYL